MASESIGAAHGDDAKDGAIRSRDRVIDDALEDIMNCAVASTGKDANHAFRDGLSDLLASRAGRGCSDRFGEIPMSGQHGAYLLDVALTRSAMFSGHWVVEEDCAHQSIVRLNEAFTSS